MREEYGESEWIFSKPPQILLLFSFNKMFIGSRGQFSLEIIGWLALLALGILSPECKKVQRTFL